MDRGRFAALAMTVDERGRPGRRNYQRVAGLVTDGRVEVKTAAALQVRLTLEGAAEG